MAIFQQLPNLRALDLELTLVFQDVPSRSNVDSGFQTE